MEATNSNYKEIIKNLEDRIEAQELQIDLRDNEIETLTQEIIPCRDARIGDLEDEIEYLITELQCKIDDINMYQTAYWALCETIERYGLFHLLDEECLLDKN